MSVEPERLDASVRRRDKTSEVIARAIVRHVQSQGLERGTRLPPEADMIADFRVGRGTLREALRILEVNGFITLKPGPGGGPIVEGLQGESFGRMATLFFQMGGTTYRELVEARLIMEPVAARLAAEHRREALSAGGLAGAATVDDVSDENEYLMHTSDFHAAVIRASSNGIVSLFCQSLADVYHERVRGVLFPVDRREDVVTAHEAIARAINTGNGSRAEKLMRQHMEEYAAFVFERHPGIMEEVVEWR
jgi:GntR family transcriptional regulator, transcriptional repressor for pyruvate dehydrogenase complex